MVNGKHVETRCVHGRTTVVNAIHRQNLWRFNNEDSRRLEEAEFRREPPSGLKPENQKFSIEIGYSDSAGQYVAFIARPFEGKNILGVSAEVMVTPLINLSDPVLPSGYAFALVDPNGQVLFHSTPSKN